MLRYLVPENIVSDPLTWKDFHRFGFVQTAIDKYFTYRCLKNNSLSIHRAGVETRTYSIEDKYSRFTFDGTYVYELTSAREIIKTNYATGKRVIAFHTGFSESTILGWDVSNGTFLFTRQTIDKNTLNTRVETSLLPPGNTRSNSWTLLLARVLVALYIDPTNYGLIISNSVRGIREFEYYNRKSGDFHIIELDDYESVITMFQNLLFTMKGAAEKQVDIIVREIFPSVVPTLATKVLKTIPDVYDNNARSLKINLFREIVLLCKAQPVPQKPKGCVAITNNIVSFLLRRFF